MTHTHHKHHKKHKAPIPVFVWVRLHHKKGQTMTPVTVNWVAVDTVFPGAENATHFLVFLSNGASMNAALDARTIQFVPGLDPGDYVAAVQLTDAAGTADFGHASAPFTIPSAPPPASAPVPQSVTVVF